MRLVQKLTVAFVAGMSIILAFNGFFRVRREVALFESARVRDHRLIGRALGAAVSAVWRTDGPGRAQAVIEQANDQERARKVDIRWTWIDSSSSDREQLLGLEPGESITRIEHDASGDVRRTFVRVPVDDRRLGALQISESLSDERAYIRTTILETAATAIVLAGFCAALSMFLGVWLVGRPMRALTEKARRVGLGDFATPLALRQKDELGELAGEMNAMCERLREATARVATETSARIAALEQLRHADRLMTVGKLASGVAHELGTPLNVIEARASMVAAGETSEDESRAYARIIVESCERMTRIIRQLLEFARRREPEKAPGDVKAIARKTIELLAPLAEKKKVRLRLRNDVSDATLRVDEVQLQQVLTNLVMNAIQAMTNEGDVLVRISAERACDASGGTEGDYLCVRVQDEGSGIAREHLGHIFEPFFTTKDVGEGTGLGLAVAYGIVQEHGGWIEVHSEMGIGSLFSIYLPKIES